MRFLYLAILVLLTACQSQPPLVKHARYGATSTSSGPALPVVTPRIKVMYFTAEAVYGDGSSAPTPELVCSNAWPFVISFTPPASPWTPDYYVVNWGTAAGQETNYVDIGTNTSLTWPIYKPQPPVVITIGPAPGSALQLQYSAGPGLPWQVLSQMALTNLSVQLTNPAGISLYRLAWISNSITIRK